MARYVKFGGVEHPFKNNSQKKALIREAQKHSRYLIVDGISVIAGFAASDCAEIRRESADVRDNLKKGRK